MTTAPDIHAAPVGEHGAPCAVCAAPLASDQRYCLSCGARRAEARLPFREILTTNAVVAAVAPPPARAQRAQAQDDGTRSALMALASIGCLLLALGVGVLIGSAGDSGTQAAAPAPQVISVGGATGATDAATGGTGAASGTAAGTAAAKKKASKAAKPTAKPTAQKNSLKQLEKLSPTQYQKQSTKLPKVVGTGGAPPPKDNKPAAGGGDFQSIG